jgi:predicted metal-dependent phosphotriesterase family hydrolase
LGQPQNPIPVEGMRLFIATLLHHGISPEEVELMVKKNPAALLNLE